MIITAWNNGKHYKTGAGYGFKVSIPDRDQYFNKAWRSVTVVLSDGAEISVNIAKDSFWTNSCRELISIHFGKWLLKNSYAPWRKGYPPKFELVPGNTNRFTLVDQNISDRI